MFHSLKKYLICVRFLILLLAITSLTITTCTNNSSTNVKNRTTQLGDEVYGELGVFLCDNIDIYDFLESYQNYRLQLISWSPFSGYTVSFNYDKIDSIALMELIEEDTRVIRVFQGSSWIHGELILGLSHFADENDLKVIIDSLKKYNLKILSQAQSINCYRLSFDPNKINEYTIREIIKSFNFVDWVDFNGPYRKWSSGLLIVQLNNKNFNDFIKTYSDYNFIIEILMEIANFITIEFDYKFYDEFLLLEMISQNPNVETVNFNHFLND